MNTRKRFVVSLAAVVLAGAVACGGQTPSASAGTSVSSQDQSAPAALSTSSPSLLPWQTGMRAVGRGATIEPAVNDTDGSQTFILTPNSAPFFNGGATPTAPIPPSLNNVNAPLYLVTYPLNSTVDANGRPPLNCYTEGKFSAGLPFNCNHALIPNVKGHDHLIGVPGSQKAGGDFNVQWHVLATFFTPQGIQDGAMNTRILTLAQLEAAQKAGDVTDFVDTRIYFYCSVVSGAVYENSTPLNFSP
jgi:hypothetical protein